jgi:hypothetical protein
MVNIITEHHRKGCRCKKCTIERFEAEKAAKKKIADASRGFRNNNPGNIRKGSNWHGLAEEQNHSAFCVFSHPTYGIRALAYLLKNVYQGRYNLDTIEKLIDRWAPPSENETSDYVVFVCNETRLEPDEPIDLIDQTIMLKVVAAIIQFENGDMPYNYELIDGIRLA